MMPLGFALRPVSQDDLELLFAWRNRPEVREFMYSSSEIELSTHKKWFASMLEDPSRCSLIMNLKGVDCAVILFADIRGSTSCTWGFYSGPSAQAGVSLLVELAGLRYAFETLRVNRLHCEVLSGNRQVINLHKKSGFTQEGCLHRARLTPRGLEDVIVFGMLKDEWPLARDRLQSRARRIYDPG